jgi:hypothetical protein
MSQQYVTSRNGVIGVFSFTMGFTASPRPALKTDDDYLAQALWLERHGRQDEAFELLDRRCKK